MALTSILDLRAVLYVVTLLFALLTDGVALVILVLVRGRLRGATGPALLAVGLHAAVTLFATPAHLLSAEHEAAKFGAESAAPVVLNIGAYGMAAIHVGGAAAIGLLLLALLRLAPKEERDA